MATLYYTAHNIKFNSLILKHATQGGVFDYKDIEGYDFNNMAKDNFRPYAFDFDGVIAKYNGFKGAENEEEPIPDEVEAIRKLKKEGHKIIINSTRGADFLKKYCKKHNIPVDYFNENPDYNTGGEKPVAFVYVDDRAICYKDQSSDELVKEIKNFKPYWRN